MVDVLRVRSFGGDTALATRALQHVARPWELPWGELQDAFDQVSGPYSYDLRPHLAEQGWRSVDLIHDLEPIQAAWIREHGPLPAARNLSTALVRAAIERFRPRVLLDLNLKVFTAHELAALRTDFPFLELTVGQINTTKRLDRAFGHDLILTPRRALIDVIRSAGGPPGRVFHHAFDPGRVAPVTGGRIARVVATGSTGRGRYSDRTRVLAALLEADAIEAWISEGKRDDFPTRQRPLASPQSFGDVLRLVPRRAHASLVRRTGRGAVSFDRRLRADPRVAPEGVEGHSGYPFHGLASVFPSRCHPAVFGDEMFLLLGSSVAAVHHSIEPGATALRHFEATGMGAALITNAMEGLEEVFDVGKEILAYRNADEAVELARWATDDPQAAARIGAAGQARTLRDHSSRARGRELAAILAEVLGGG